MKLKYYMRGLGIGIVVTALLMGFAISKQKEPMTDEEIRQRALEMGMIEQNGVLAEDLGNTEEEPAEVPDENVIVSENAIENRAENETEEVTEDLLEGIEDAGVSETEPQETDSQETEKVVITVSGGDGSRTVANKLQEAGLIEDAVAYDAYLCQNGYDKRIATGAHEISMGASLEEIAKEITTRKN